MAYWSRLIHWAAITLACASSVEAKPKPFYTTLVSDQATALTVRVDGDDKDIPVYAESHALVIGQVNYQHWDKLALVPDEIANVTKALERQHFKAEVYFDLTSDDMVEVINDFMQRYGTVPNSRIVVYMSGHGFQRNVVEHLGYFIGIDAPKTGADNTITAKSLPMQMFAAWARLPDPRHMFFIFDACFSGAFFANRGVDVGVYQTPRPASARPTVKERRLPSGQIIYPPDSRGLEYSNYVFSDEPSSPGRQFLAAGDSNEPAPVLSVMTQLLIDILDDRNPAAQVNTDNWTSVTEIGNWLASRTADLSSAWFKDESPAHPVFGTLPNDQVYNKGDMIFLRSSQLGISLVEPPDEVDKWGQIASTSLDVSTVLVSETAKRLADSRAQVEEIASEVASANHRLTSLIAASAVVDTKLTKSTQLSQRLTFHCASLPFSGQTNCIRSALPTSVAQDLTATQDEKARLGNLTKHLSVTLKTTRQKLETALATAQVLTASLAKESASLAERRDAIRAAADNALLPNSAMLSPDEEAHARDLIDKFSSDTTEVRRKARSDFTAFLASLAAEKKSPLVNRLVTELARKSYRYQTGIALAIADQTAPIQLQNASEVQAELKNALSIMKGRDPTIRGHLQKAISNIHSAQ